MNRAKTYYKKYTDSYIFLIEKYGIRYVIGFISKTTHISFHIGAFGYNFGILLQRNGGSYDFNLSIWLIYLSFSFPRNFRWKQLK